MGATWLVAERQGEWGRGGEWGERGGGGRKGGGGEARGRGSEGNVGTKGGGGRGEGGVYSLPHVPLDQSVLRRHSHFGSHFGVRLLLVGFERCKNLRSRVQAARPHDAEAGKCSASRDILEMMLAGVMSSPTSLADCSEKLLSPRTR